MQQELESREQRLQRELSEKKRMETRMHGLVSDEKLRWQKECVSTKAQQDNKALGTHHHHKNFKTKVLSYLASQSKLTADFKKRHSYRFNRSV